MIFFVAMDAETDDRTNPAMKEYSECDASSILNFHTFSRMEIVASADD